MGPDGSVYIADSSSIRRVGTDGNIHTFAGQLLQSGFSGDEGSATAALLHLPSDIAFGPDGSLYIADSYNNRIRRVDPAGIIHTVAGSGPNGVGTGSYSGDGLAATQATLNQPSGVDIGADGASTLPTSLTVESALWDRTGSSTRLPVSEREAATASA